MKPRGTWLASRAETLEGPVLDVPLVPRATHTDGVLDEAAWAYAGRLDLAAGDPLLALADGCDLVLALPHHGAAAIRLRTEDGRTLRIDLPATGAANAPAGIRAATRTAPGRTGLRTTEIRIGAEALGAAAWPTRVLDVKILGENEAGDLDPRWQGTLLLVP
jgi:hypothetical protein